MSNKKSVNTGKAKSGKKKLPVINNAGILKDKYNAIVEIASEAIFIHNINGEIVEVNNRACDLSGYTKKELLKMNIVDIEQDYTIEQARNEWKKIKPPNTYKLIGTHKRKDGKVLPAEIRVGSFDIEGERFFIGFVRDISDEKKNEEEIVKREERFRDTLDNLLEGCQIISRNLIYIYLNEAAERHNRRPKEELLGKRYNEMWPGVEKTEAYRLINDTLENRIPHKLEVENKFQDGSIGWFDVSLQPVPEGIFILTVDITERKNAEYLLKESESRLRFALEGANEGTWELDLRSNEVYLSPRATEILGYSMKEYSEIAKNREMYIHPEDFPVTQQKLQDHLSGKSEFYETEHRVKSKTGEYKWILSRARISERDETGKPLKLTGTFTDATEKRKNIESLISSEKKYKYLFDRNPLPMWVYDLDTLKYLDVNESAVKSYGYSREEFLKMSLKDIRPKEDWEALQKDVESTRDVLNRAGIWRHRKKNGEIIFVEIISHLIDFDGKPARLVLANNVTERINAEQKVRESEIHFRNLADSGQALIWTSSTDKKCDYFNKVWLEFTGRKLEQELGDGWAEGVHPDDLQRCVEIYTTAFDRRESFSMEYRLMHRSGEYRWIIDEGSPRYGENGEFIGYIGHCLDITERKQAEEKIYETTERFRQIFEGSPFGMTLVGRDQKYYRANKTFCEMMGYSEEELINMTFRDITYEDDVQNDIENVKKILNNKIPVYKAEKRYKRKDGRIIWGSMTSIANFSKKGEFVYGLVIVEDITDKKLSVDKMIEANERFRKIFEESPYGMTMVGKDFKFISANKRYCEMMGYTEKEFQDLTFKDITYEEDREKGVDDVIKLIKGEIPVLNVEKRYVRKDGKMIIGNLTVTAHFSKSGEFMYNVAMIEDITEKKKTQERLIESEERFRKIYEESPFAIMIVDRNFKMTATNRKCCDMMGYEEEELKHFTFRDITHEEDKDKDVANVIRLMKGEIPVFKTEKRYVRKDGKIVWGRLTVTANYTNSGEFLYNVAIIEDITERKESEEKINEANERFRSVYEEGPYGIVLVGRDFKFISANRKYCNMLGYTEEELRKFTFLDITHPDDKERNSESVKKLNNKEISVYKTEKRFVKKKGEIIWGYITIAANFTKKGEFLYYIGIVEDITDKKHSEESLNKLTERLNLATSASQIGIWDWDIKKDELIWDDIMYKLHGRKKEDYKVAYEAWLDGLHPEDREKSDYVIQQAVRGEKDFDTEFRVLWPDGSIHWIKAKGDISLDEEGKPVRMIGVNYDITEQKQREEELAKLSERLNLATKSSQIGIWDWDIKNNILIWDEMMYKIYGRKEGDFGGAYEAWVDSLHPDDRERSSEFSQKAVRGEVEYDTEFKIQWPDGSVHWIKGTGDVFRDEAGNAVRMVGVNYDITERKHYEDNLKKLSERLNLATSAAQIGIWEIDLKTYSIVWDEITCRIYGVNLNTVSNSYTEWLKIMHPADRGNFLKYAESILNKGGDIDVEFRIIWKDGTVRWVKSKGEVIHDGNGNPIKMVGVNYDITEQKNSEEALRLNEERFRQIVETSGVWVWEVDKNGLYTYVSKMEEGILGYKTEEIVGKKHFYDFFISEIREDLMKGAFEVMNRKEIIRNFDNPNIHKNGKTVYLETSGIPLFDEEGNLIGYRGADRDITERKLAELEIKRFNEELEKRVVERTTELTQSNRDLEAFAYSVSHDLRAPLRAISGFSGLLLEDYYDKLDSEGKEYLNDIMRNAKNMAKLIDDLLQLSRYGRKQLEKTEINMKQLIVSVFEEEKKIRNSNAKLKIGELPEVTGDYTLMKQLAINLIGNAIKFSSKNPNPEIETGFTETKDEVTFFIKDNGVGFDMKYSGKLFGVFQRLHRADEFAGTGVGLAIVSRIITKHSGKIWAESELGKGATFYFSLPKE